MVWDRTQGVYAVRSAYRSLRLPLANVRVIGHYMGGGFGSKLEAGKYTVVAALLARMTAGRSSSSCRARTASGSSATGRGTP